MANREYTARIETFEQMFILSELFPDNEFLNDDYEEVIQKHLPHFNDPHLGRLKNAGYVEGFKDKTYEGKGRPMRVYRLTEKGMRMATHYERFIERGLRFMKGDFNE